MRGLEWFVFHAFWVGKLLGKQLDHRTEINGLAGLDTGVGAVSSINSYYGRPNLPVGAYKGPFDATVRGSYVDDLVQRFPGAITNASQAPDALQVRPHRLENMAVPVDGVQSVPIIREHT